MARRDLCDAMRVFMMCLQTKMRFRGCSNVLNTCANTFRRPLSLGLWYRAAILETDRHNDYFIINDKIFMRRRKSLKHLEEFRFKPKFM